MNEQKIKDAVVKCCPEIMELKFGCEVYLKKEAEQIEFPQYNYPEKFVFLTHCGGGQIADTGDYEDYTLQLFEPDTKEIYTTDRWEKALDKLSLKTQEENWTCDAGCGVDKDKIKSFIRTLLKKQAEEISEAVGSLYKAEVVDESDVAYLTRNNYNLALDQALLAIKQVINK